MTEATAPLDRAAVRALRDEKLDWRFRSIPERAFGMTTGEFLATGPSLTEFLGPVLTLDEPALDHNLRTMAEWCAQRGVLLAPHGKTTMAPRLFERQLDHGAWGITAATAGQLRVYRAFGLRRVLLANQLVDPQALRWLSGELDADPGFDCACWVDSLRGVRLMDEALTGRRPLDVLVELGAPGGRTGARGVEESVEIARAVAASPKLRLVGVAGYEAAIARSTDPSALETVDAYLGDVRELALRLDHDDLFETEHVLVSCGGSSYFDQVTDALTTDWPTRREVFPVLRSGAYLTHDDGLYRGMSPLGREHRLTGAESPFQSAMRIWAQITSHPEPTLALATMGRRDVSFDAGLPEPQVVCADEGTAPLTGCRVTALADQHAFLDVPADSGLRVGDRIGFGLSHPCTVFDRWSLIPLVRDDEVVDLIRTFF
ncbi:amino acid deaminase [Allosaccharopolyspora coralli]|uniref:Amino acid deaminase n=1 Tax=Allosaccharopolyspora coralli TaxID=2665642 RepID=A0A5Q3Q7G4_9PSEU|nr:amino acid deaminase [Allosaccharopolyspora coralli]QGK70601.1 amino acid deaminase [Allosaccharopolyspora coralli]